jgi:hypothetical protein
MTSASPTIVIDPERADKRIPGIALTPDYWDKFVAALRDSGALDKRVEVDAEAEVVEPTAEETEPSA